MIEDQKLGEASLPAVAFTDRGNRYIILFDRTTHLPAAVRNNAPSKVTDDLSQNEQFVFSDTPTLDEVKKRYVLHVLRSVQGNVSRAAKVLNLDRRSLYRMLARYKIEHFS